jgi:restriction system protein
MNEESWWRALSGQDFERAFQRLLEKRNYLVEHTGGAGDQGVDLRLRTPDGPVIVQCKAHAARIGPGAVRDLWGSIQHHAAFEGWLVSLSGYSEAAMKFAHGKPIKLLTLREFLE